jgi:MFS family permease
MQAGFNNVILLMLSNALAFSAVTMLVLIGSLLGVQLSPSPNLATLPLALMVVGTAAGVLPATQLMKKIGRKNGLFSFMALAFLACILASFSLQLKSFWLFCASTTTIGITSAALQQIRFAAMEAVAPSKASTAASIIMSGGIIAAFLGPELALMGRDLTAVEYQGSFWLMAASIISAASLLIWYKPTQQLTTNTINKSRSTAALFKNPNFVLALFSGLAAFAVMTFIMTGTPISMMHHFDHSFESTKWVIQSHIAAMFLPSFIAPLLFKLLGTRGMMTAGLVCYCATISMSYIDTSVSGFWIQLVMLGIGWNFLFVAGTSLLPSTYKEGEQFKAQAVNDSTVFGAQAIASLSAGWVIGIASWPTMLSLCLIPILIMFTLLIRSKLSETNH